MGCQARLGATAGQVGGGGIKSKLHLAHHTQAALYAVKQRLVTRDELEIGWDAGKIACDFVFNQI
jgi:hypothetical protein